MLKAWHDVNRKQNRFPLFPHLSISPDSPSTIVEQFRHVIVADKLPQAGLQVQVSVEP